MNTYQFHQKRTTLEEEISVLKTKCGLHFRHYISKTFNRDVISKLANMYCEESSRIVELQKMLMEKVLCVIDFSIVLFKETVSFQAQVYNNFSSVVIICMFSCSGDAKNENAKAIRVAETQIKVY